ncbi:putative protein TPRXL [Alosa alosa]|uniref:putative protein TPRXL n=1 Tax=Alosa alosa TaxID=278164 RepID=UPI00201547E9|nr:putative protein TPRXL [Alosa alosa]
MPGENATARHHAAQHTGTLPQKPPNICPCHPPSHHPKQQNTPTSHYTNRKGNMLLTLGWGILIAMTLPTGEDLRPSEYPNPPNGSTLLPISQKHDRGFPVYLAPWFRPTSQEDAHPIGASPVTGAMITRGGDSSLSPPTPADRPANANLAPSPGTYSLTHGLRPPSSPSSRGSSSLSCLTSLPLQLIQTPLPSSPHLLREEAPLPSNLFHSFTCLFLSTRHTKLASVSPSNPDQHVSAAAQTNWPASGPGQYRCSPLTTFHLDAPPSFLPQPPRLFGPRAASPSARSSRHESAKTLPRIRSSPTGQTPHHQVATSKDALSTSRPTSRGRREPLSWPCVSPM